MQTAGVSPTRNVTLPWDFSVVHFLRKDQSPSYMAVMHFSELQDDAVRQFYIYVNGIQWNPRGGLTPDYHYSDALYTTIPFNDNAGWCNVSFNATPNSTLPPILNAIEFFVVISTTDDGTDSQDGTCIYKKIHEHTSC